MSFTSRSNAFTLLLFAALVSISSFAATGDYVISGEQKKWHKITLTFEGPNASETGTPNPFVDYRMNVTFTNGSTSYVVPGYFSADGDAANTSAGSGNKWRVHFAPDATGTWTFTVSFRSGNGVAVDDSPTAGSAVADIDGVSGTFSVAATDKTGRDLRGKGRLNYVGGHYLQFAETGEYMLKQGADAPENLLAYEDFDGDFKSDGVNDNRIKAWAAHVGDWQTGDPTWQTDKGKGIIGAINYLASEGLNAFSFIPMNIGGDDKNCFPYLTYNNNVAPQEDRTRIDCSRMDQWGIVFDHGTKMGMFLHFKTQETENELLLDGGDLGTERKLYYRELIARFGHNLALNWNLGEEINDATTEQKQSWAQYFYDHDPYHHHLVIHNGRNHYDLLGSASKLTGFSKQTGQTDFSEVHDAVKNYITRSADAGRPWAVACDEPGDASYALRPDDDAANSHEDGRKNGIWGTFMAGGWGNEWYFGYKLPESDLSCEDFRSRDNYWDYCRYALQFFRNNIPFWEMSNDNALSSATDDYCFYKAGQCYIVYLKNGGTTTLDLSGATGNFEVKWYDPRNGGALQNGSVTQVAGGSASASLGNPPGDNSSDWTILVRYTSGGTNTAPSVNAGSDQTIILPDLDAELNGTVTDDGLPDPPATVTSTWSKVSGPGTAAFTDANAVDTTVTFSEAGVYVLRLTADDSELSNSADVTITVQDPAEADQVEFLTLINADSDQPVDGFNPIADGATINLQSLPTTNLNIRANTNPATVGSVRFGYDGDSNYQTESSAPYAIAGDNAGDYNAWTPTVGSHTVVATPYSEANAGGTAGVALSINFTVTDDPVVDPNQPPVIDSAASADPDTITISGSTTLTVAASDADGDTLTYAWTRTSGPGTATITPNGTSNSDSATANFDAIGEYSIEVVVDDSNGGTVTDSVTVTVTDEPNEPPVIDIAASATPATITVSESSTLAVAASDPDVDTLTYTWTKTTGPGNVTISPNGTTADSSSATFGAAGSYELQVLVADGKGGTVTDSVTVTVEADSNAGDGRIAVDGNSYFGAVYVDGGSAVRSFTIRNTGTATLLLTGSPIVAVSDGSYTVTSLPTASIPVDGSSSFEITFDPAATGTFDATVTIESDDSTTPSYSLAITGEGLEGSDPGTVPPPADDDDGCHVGFGGSQLWMIILLLGFALTRRRRQIT